MADGSIRIEATVSDEQAKKQIAQMTKDIEKQSAVLFAVRPGRPYRDDLR